MSGSKRSGKKKVTPLPVLSTSPLSTAVVTVLKNGGQVLLQK